MRVVSFKCSKYLIREVDKLAYKLKVSRSEIIRRALIKYLVAHGYCKEIIEWMVEQT